MTLFRAETQRRLTFYIIPILIGAGGIIYSQQLENPLWRYLALLISVGLPLYAGSNLLSRYRTSMLERALMFLGVMLLLLGAAYSISGFSESLLYREYVSEDIINISRIVGMLSLFLGLFVVLFSAVQTQESIDEMADRFRFLAEHISEGFILSLPSGSIILVNQRALDMFGLKREEVIGRDAKDLATSFGLDSIARELQARSAGVVSEYEVVWRIGGQERILLFNGAPVFNRQGSHTLTMATIRDVTEYRQLTRRVEQYANELQKQVEAKTRELRRSENRLRHLLESMNEGFITLDKDYRISFANAQASLLLKSSINDLRGKEIFDYVDNVGKSRLLNLFAQAVEEKQKKELRQEINLISITGDTLPALVGVAYIGDIDESGTGFSLVITPIAELKRMQLQSLVRARELERVNEELKQHDRAKDAFLSNVSHELRTPLTTIQGYLEMLLGNGLGEINDAQKHAIEVMERNARHLLTHINEMIEFSHMQIRGIHIRPDLFDVTALSKEALAAIHPATEEKKIEIHLNIPPVPLYALGDREKLTQVLGILLNNAIKFTDTGGTITLSAFSEKGTDVILEVRDTGIGIDPAYHEKIFNRFFQVDSSKTRKYEGAGIGLSIAMNIVQAHKGTITVESAIGQGATFRVHLPDAIFSATEEVETDSIDQNLRILLIDDSEERRNALCSVPPLCRCEVLFASSGHVVMRQVDAESIDLILLNDSPEDIGGKTTLRILRQNASFVTVPVVVLTSEKNLSSNHDIATDKNVFVLAKPFTGSLLAQVIYRAISGIEEPLDFIEGLSHTSLERQRPYVIVIDSDPGFLEWVATALKEENIDVERVLTSVKMIPHEGNTKPPVAIFVDADMSPRQWRDICQMLQADPVIADKPLYILTSMKEAHYSFEKRQAAGILHKPFPISDMTAIIKKHMNSKS